MTRETYIKQLKEFEDKYKDKIISDLTIPDGIYLYTFAKKEGFILRDFGDEAQIEKTLNEMNETDIKVLFVLLPQFEEIVKIFVRN